MAAARRRIALIAPPWYPIPPDGYGGTELVVGLLVQELRSQGHDVLLFGAEGSRLASHAIARPHWSGDLGRPEERLRELTYAAWVLRQLAEVAPIDVIHDHCGSSMLLGAALTSMAPVVHTVHGSIDEPLSTFLEALPRRVGLIAISAAQRSSSPALPWTATIHNAVDLAALHVAEPSDKEPYLLCLARVCPAKGQHLAIEVARRTRRRLILAGKIEATPEGLQYYERCIAPALDGEQIVHIHNVAGAEKARLLARATALLAPLQWEEPFGLFMAEAMASGTPVIAFRRGAAPELVTPGESGFLVDNVDEMAAAVPLARLIDPERCATLARCRFSPETMAREHLRAYERAILEQATKTVRLERAFTWLPTADSPAHEQRAEDLSDEPEVRA